ncbi:MAG: undecaprenyl-diphosphate phosphatase [Eubacterium sp.]|nr:undecaprenyl-diphosphate phosphatase [Eubacterium sp.]
MDLMQSVIMGIIQGVTEFLPVSSSGHLAIFKIMFHVDTSTGLLFDVLLHIGTLIAVFIVYYKDIFQMIAAVIGIIADSIKNIGTFFHNIGRRKKQPFIRVIHNGYRKFVLLVIVSTIPTGIIGYVAGDLVEAASEILLIPGICLLVTGTLLIISDRVPDGGKGPKTVTYANSFVIGICQGIATLPGLSRSGTTITACLLSGFDRKFAVKYSFIMSVPAILGAAVLELKDFKPAQLVPGELKNYIIGMIVSAVVGYVCIKTMLVIVRKKKFTYFALYCYAIGAISIFGYLTA